MRWTNEETKSKKNEKKFSFSILHNFLDEQIGQNEQIAHNIYGTSRLKAKQDNDFDLQD